MILLRAGVASAVVLIALAGSPTAFAGDPPTESPVAKALEAYKHRTENKKETVIPSPGKPTTTITTPGTSGGGTRALKNLENEEANRTQRQILEQLK